MVVIEPTFEIDEKGRVICQSHSKYPYFIQPNKTDFEDEQMEKELTCLTCSHYKNDEVKEILNSSTHYFLSLNDVLIKPQSSQDSK